MSTIDLYAVTAAAILGTLGFYLLLAVATIVRDVVEAVRAAREHRPRRRWL